MSAWRPLLRSPDYCHGRRSVSPDLNPVEKVWAAMKSGLRHKPVYGSSDELFALLNEIRDSIDALPDT